MRKLMLSLLLAAFVPAGAAAQGMWQTEFGIRGGYTSYDFTDADVQGSVIDLPFSGGLLGGATLGQAPLYAIIPLNDRMAVSPSFGFQNASFGPNITGVIVGARLNYAFSDAFYGAAGPTAYIIKADGSEDTQGAFELALGYRRSAGGSFRLHAEAFYETREESEILPQATAYGIRIGAGTTLSGGNARGARRASDAMWTPSIGIQGGWSLVSFTDAADITTFTLPFGGSSTVGGLLPLQTPGAISALLPVGERMAIEPSFDLHYFDLDGSDATTYSLGGRVNYAFTRTAYAGAGLNLTALDVDGVDDGSSMAWLLAAGLRFPIVGALNGRTEINYRVFDGTDIAPSGQTTSFVFGILVPIN